MSCGVFIAYIHMAEHFEFIYQRLSSPKYFANTYIADFYSLSPLEKFSKIKISQDFR